MRRALARRRAARTTSSLQPHRGLRILEYAVLAKHVHLFVEADSQAALPHAMRVLGVRLAKRLNRCFGRRGAWLAEGYHARRLQTPRETSPRLARNR